MNLRRIVLIIAGAVASATITGGILGGLVQSNVQTLAEARGWNSLLLRWWPDIVSLASWMDTPWFWFVCGFSSGVFVCALVLRRPSAVPIVVHSALHPADPDEWQPLGIAALSGLHRELQSPNLKQWTVFVHSADKTSARLAQSFRELFDRLGWPSSIGDAGVLGVGESGIVVHPEDATASAFKDALERVGLPVKLSGAARQARDKPIMMVIIGRKPSWFTEVDSGAPLEADLLEVIVARGGNYESTQVNRPGVATKIISVGVKNRSTKRFLSNCKLYLDVPERDGRPMQTYLLVDSFTLQATEERYVQIAYYDEPAGPGGKGGNHIRLCLPVSGGWLGAADASQLPVGAYAVVLKATSSDAKTSEVACRTWVDENGKFHFEKA